MVDPKRLELVEPGDRPGEGLNAWQPFAASDEFDRQWWDLKQFGDMWVMQARLDDVEVARIRLNPHVDLTGYVGVPTARMRDLEIERFEVAARRLHQGIGTAVIRAVAGRYPDRRLVASSMEAKGFWAKLGWKPCVDASESRRRWPMFVS